MIITVRYVVLARLLRMHRQRAKHVRMESFRRWTLRLIMDLARHVQQEENLSPNPVLVCLRRR